jgi:XTP/dITP diphosphohydrolase
MKQIVLATRNQGKVNELMALAQDFNLDIQFLSLTDVGFNKSIDETGESLSENARIKAWEVAKEVNLPVLADDSGLFVEHLKGAPGVYSARYSGESATDNMNNEKLLSVLKGVENRNAFFSTVLCLVSNKKEVLFEGVLNGTITNEPLGTDGFGYDTIFIPSEGIKTFAEMNQQEKNGYSHRKNAFNHFARWFKNYYEN